MIGGEEANNDEMLADAGSIRAALLGLASHASPTLSQLRATLLERAPRSWSLEVRASQIDGAGDGLFLCGECEAGTLVALYPGTAYHLEDLHVMARLVLEGNSYVLGRRDGVLIDGRPSGLSRQIFETAIARERASKLGARAQGNAAVDSRVICQNAIWESLSWPIHPLAAGHMANHPPKGHSPNVKTFVIDLAMGEEEDLQVLLPFASFRPPADGEAIKQGVALVATRHLEDEEILLDYKLRLDGPLEPWYVPCVDADLDGQGEVGCGDRMVESTLKASDPKLPPFA